MHRRNVAKKPDRQKKKERLPLCYFLHGEKLEVSKILFPVFRELEACVFLTIRFARILGIKQESKVSPLQVYVA